MIEILKSFSKILTRDAIVRLMFIPRNLSREPSQRSSSISDLFLIRQNQLWKTEFELLNINALISGESHSMNWSHVEFWFFSGAGKIVGKKSVPLGEALKNTLKLSDLTKSLTVMPSTFAVFHSPYDSVEYLSHSYIAERGYVGYEYSELGMKSYVHGNLDAVACADGTIEPLGNSGFLRRIYTVQHLLSGEAKYEFAFTNPTKKSQKIEMQRSELIGKWEKLGNIKIGAFGSDIFSYENDSDSKCVIRFRSRMYLARPVVFRTTRNSMDVFHG